MNLSKAIPAIIISAIVATPAFAETKGKPGYYGVDQKGTTFFVTNFPPDAAQQSDSDAAKLCYTKDGDKEHFSKYNCGYYHVSAAVLEKMGIDPNAPPPPESANAVASAPAFRDPCRGLSGNYFIPQDRHMDCPLYQNTNQCRNSFCLWVNPNEEYRNAYYYPVPQPYYSGYYYTPSYCCYSSGYNNGRSSKAGRVVGGIVLGGIIGGALAAR